MDLIILRTPPLLKEVFKTIALHENYLSFTTDKDRHRHYIWDDILNTINHSSEDMILDDDDHYGLDIGVRLELYRYVESIKNWLLLRYQILGFERLNGKYITIRVTHADKRHGKTKHIQLQHGTIIKESRNDPQDNVDHW